jgi:ubiquinone/menaquinone biosynthesis C-methylase UbiE
MTEYLERSIDYENPEVASAWDELSVWSSRFGALLLDTLEMRGGIQALDLGCGTGFPLFELAQRHGPSCRFVGVDIWVAGLARAALKRRVHALPNVHLVRADGAHLPFAAAQFDLIVSNLGINNFADPAAALAECARVARPGARLALTTNPQGHMREFYAVYRELLAERNRADYLARLEANEDHRATPATIGAMLAAAGFAVARVVESEFTMRFVDGGALFRHALTRIGFLDGWRRVVDPADEVAIFTELEARLDALARDQGELVMSIPMLYIEGRKRGDGSSEIK